MKIKDFNKNTIIFLSIALVAVKLFFSYTQFATIYPPLAPLDDDLMFKAAQSITNGNWLGEYNYLTISKHMGFSIWLALLHFFKIPYLVGNMILWSFASFVTVIAVSKVLNKNWCKLFLFAGLLYNPAASAQYATRIYRDSIFPALCLIFFASIIAIGLRYKDKLSSWLVWLILLGISFGCIYLTREDGIWVLPFAVVAVLVVVFKLFKENIQSKALKTTCFIVPILLSAVIISSYCFMNYKHYGRFIVSDFTSKEFKSAYGAMTSLQQDNWHPMVAVPEDVRQDLYKNIPMIAPLEEELKEPLIIVGYKNETIGDFSSGAFYWAMRSALDNLGVYNTPQKSQQYFEELTAEIQSAVDSGILKTENGSNKLRKSVTAPIKPEYIVPVLQETLKGFVHTISFKQCDPLAECAVGEVIDINAIQDYIGQKGLTGFIDNTDIPYLNPVRKITHYSMQALAIIYKIFIPLMLLVSIIWQIKQFNIMLVDKKPNINNMLNLILFGILGMAFLRCAMIAFVEVSAFGIGTYTMYLSTVHPLIILYSFIGCCKTFEN